MPLYGVLGYTCLGLLAVITSPWWLRKLNSITFKSKSPGYLKTLRVLRALHKPLAAALVVVMAMHGWLALGGIRLHTGTVLAAALLLTMCFGLAFYFTKKRALLMTHKGFALATVALFLVHFFAPGLLSGLG